MLIEPYQPSDRGFLTEMMRLVLLETYPEVASVGRIELRERLEGIMARYYEHPGEIWVAREGETPIGMLWWLAEIHPVTEVRGLLLVALAVVPEYRRRGVARSLLQKAVEKRRPMRLFVNPDNQKAQRLYEALGFVPKILEMVKTP